MSTTPSTSTTSNQTTNHLTRPTWDASKVPPSQFQRPPGSIYSTPNSKDGNVERGDRDRKYFDKLREKGWVEK